MTKRRKQTITLICCIIILLVVSIVGYFYLHSSAGLSSESNFFLNNIVGLSENEVIAGMGEPTNSNMTFGKTFYYHDFEIYGMYGNITIEFNGDTVETAYWDLKGINTDAYSKQIEKIRKYFNKHYSKVDTNDWKDSSVEISIVGLKTGEYIRLLFD